MIKYIEYLPLSHNEKSTFVYFALNIEDSEPSGLGHGYTNVKFSPDFKNHSWRMYGLYEGMFNILERFAVHQVPIALLINSNIVIKYPFLAKALQSYKNIEIVAHGKTNTDYFHELTYNQQINYIKEVKNTLEDFFSVSVEGWLSPWINGNEYTLKALSESGFYYTLDWSCSDFLTKITCNHGTLVSVPYNIEVNDTPSLCAKSLTTGDYFQSMRDYIDGLSLIANQNMSPVVAFPLHTPVIGRPHRLLYLEQQLSFFQQLHREKNITLTLPGDIACQ
ncbi:polysaccharide deacetylase family protein [Photorhabdus antumapuensis]|uniref:hypothetical protein n=1 Tax=Photorhabdus antumapuensis TaxID=2862867 RepID=UPI001CECE463|nr:hypothetical protein [Photorhabdus antumapuensis]MCA6222476.1 hypothetical protein [Photorhabdus antumapuensis]